MVHHLFILEATMHHNEADSRARSSVAIGIVQYLPDRRELSGQTNAYNTMKWLKARQQFQEKEPPKKDTDN